MPPRKQTRKRGASQSTKTSKRTRKASTEDPSPIAMSIKDQVVGRKSNKLTDFFVSTSQPKEANPITTTKVPKKRSLKTKRPAAKSKKSASRDLSATPPNTFQQLQNEMDSMTRQSVYLHDDDVPESTTDNNKKSRQNRSKLTRIQASPPTFTNFTSESEDNSEYVEQVSHHTIELQDNNNNTKSKTDGRRRRSSYLNRGRRMLSIGSGFDVNPHDEIPPADYYKMLSPAISSTEKMKKLLVWCIRASMDRKEKQLPHSSEDKTVFNIARVVTEEILKGLIDDEISVEWRSQPKPAQTGTNGVFIVPNPHNVDNRINIEKYRAKLAEVKREKAELMRSYNHALKAVQKDSKLVEPSHFNLADHQNRIPISALDGTVVNLLTSAQTEAHKVVSNFQNNSVNQLSTTTYQMKSVSELVGTLEDSIYAPKVSELLKNYINKNSVDNYKKLERNHKNIWPIPGRLVSTNELLVAMTKTIPRPNE